MSELAYSHHEPTDQVRLIAYKDIDAIFRAQFGQAYDDYRRDWYAAQDGRRIPEFPLSLDFETNNFCNLRCRMCLFSTNLHPDSGGRHGFLKPDLFRRLVDEGHEHGLPAMTFGFESESLLNPDLVDMITYARQHSVMDIRVGTNGMLLDDDMARQLIDSGLTRLEVSVDAIRPETYAAVRKGGNYYRLLRNIFGFLERREAAGSVFPLLRVSFLKLDANRDELADFIGFWRHVADYFSIQNLLDYEIMDFENSLPTQGEQAAQRDFRCAKINQRMYVRYNGQALPCGYVFGWEGLNLGDLNAVSVREAWNSPKFSELRRMHMAHRYMDNEYCLRCVSHTTTGGLMVEDELGRNE
ncbi:MoaA/NifB/PqqE/SkfB family radical SAM enzyme [Desulfobaculum xiamenense]|uniref:MoaA/NifB/PqqE/SkfB family radical SAM enzyme n=1 Tax=Desulfobaculum xiamenense TaxID=995050 RepID=A0A846QPE1_9BACT|nr:radical SAM protein [Desulfobaculum xiamenense]NJB67084.1 MoaA/NifB/PqqE/SkfB family radical SAM enzyme [Desulfobaculum xiamenense]